MKLLSNLEARVEEILQQRHSELVRVALEYNLKKHNNVTGCRCDYCIQIPEYVRARMHMQRCKKMLENDYYYDWPDTSQFHYENSTDRVRYLKERKDALKSLDNPIHIPVYMVDDEGEVHFLRDVLDSNGQVLYHHYDRVKMSAVHIPDSSGTMFRSNPEMYNRMLAEMRRPSMLEQADKVTSEAIEMDLQPGVMFPIGIEELGDFVRYGKPDRQVTE